MPIFVIKEATITCSNKTRIKLITAGAKNGALSLAQFTPKIS